MKRAKFSLLRWLFRNTSTLIGAAISTMMCFLVLPLIQELTEDTDDIRQLLPTNQGFIEPPEPVVEDEEPEEPEEPEELPDLAPETPQMDLAALELALGEGGGEGWMSGAITGALSNLAPGDDLLDQLTGGGSLDQRARVIHREDPILNAKMRRLSGTVTMIFTVDARGRVKNPRVRNSTDPIFNKAALAAIKKWRYEPAKKNGKPTASRKEVKMKFNKSS